ncbi:MAG: hypothetical protein PGN25_12830 [Methylorubrum populi]
MAGAALAQQGSNWIDPPAKSGASAAGGERAKGPAKPSTKAAAKPTRPEAESEASSRRETHRHDRARAAEMRRARRAAIRERAREHAHARTYVRTYADAARIDRPAPPPAASPARAEPDRRFSGWAVAARRLSLDYLDSVSAPSGTALAAAPHFYGSRVRFHGRTMSIGALMAEKRRFVRRWPERRYEPQGEPKVACDGPSATCLVRVVHDFTAVSPARGARSRGIAELTLTVDFSSGQPVIVAESSRVLSRAGA